MTQYDTIVVGGGMVGMACALGLAQAGFSVALVESQAAFQYDFPASHEPYDSRVVAISHASSRLFDELGIGESIKSARYAPYEDMIVWDSERDGQVHFSAASIFEPNLGAIIEQRVILSALWQAVKAHSKITCFFKSVITALRCDQTRCEIDLKDHPRLSAALLIGADGAKSMVRQRMLIDTHQKDYHQTAIVATLKTSLPHRSTAYQRFASDGPLAWLPLADPHLMSIVWSTTEEAAKALCALPPEIFNRRITQECDHKLGALTLVGERFTYPLTTHHAKHYVLPRCALVGDAAHTIHPLAGMGVNLGFLDVAVLIELLARAKTAKRDPGALGWLKRYERRRRWHNGAIRQTMSLFKTGFGSRSPWIEAVRNKGLNYVNQRPNIKRFFMLQALL